MNSRSRLALLALVLSSALVATACAPSGSPAPAEPSSTASAPSASASAVEIPTTPVGDRVRWTLDILNAEADTDAATWEKALAPAFLEKVPADQVAMLLNSQIRPAKPIVPTGYRGTETQAVVTMAGTVGDPFDLTIGLDAGGLIETLVLGPAHAERTPAATVDEVETRLMALGTDVRVSVTLGDREVLASDTKSSAPLGSIFKLYVLDAVADAVADGSLSWDDTVTVTEGAKSLPSGELQDAEDGTTVTVRDAAEKMIRISDNTATDLLIAKVGRAAVEKAVERLGHHAPAEMRPFLTTRELFQLLWGGHDELAQRWAEGDEKARRAVLVEVDVLPLDIDLSTIDATTRWQRGMEWFASADDIARAHAGLAERAESVPEIGEILAANPGIAIDERAWPSVAFKGGSSPGVLTGSWRAVRADGTTATIVVLTSSDDAERVGASQAELFGLVQDLFSLLSEE